MARRMRVVAATAVVVAMAGAVPARAGDSPAPSVTGPVTGGGGVNLIGPNVSSLGYTQEEFFLEGEATAYEPVGRLRSNGKWRVEETETAPFKTRIVVQKPSDPADFNGTVFVEWLNVSPGFDNPPDWLTSHNYFVREGAIWVGVSAQEIGVQGGGDVIDNPEAPPPGGLKAADPARYDTLTHPGDAFSYDIFTQAGRAVRGEGDGPNPLDGYDIQHVLAIGESQSAGRMATYVNAFHPLAGMYDGYFVHSRRGQPAPFGAAGTPGEDDPDIPNDVKIRRDLDVPVLTFETEGDLLGLDFTPARQPDSKRFRLWEVAGTSHADSYLTQWALTDLGDGTAEAAILDPAQATGGRLSCDEFVNAGGQHTVVSAALDALATWVRDGTPPPRAPRLQTEGRGADATVVRDEHGIAVGGIRTPIVEVPIATNDGEPNTGGDFCQLVGHTKPFDAETLTELYPEGEAGYVEAFEAAADEAVADGYWLEADAELWKAGARQITFG